jgi:hypothetical protein
MTRFRRSLLVVWLAMVMYAGAASSQYSYERVIYDACAYYGCDAAWLIDVMYCESGGDHGAVGPNGERGIFQFHPNGEWPYAAWYSAEQQIWLAAELFSEGRSDAWVCAG